MEAQKTREYIANRFKLDLSKQYIDIPNTDRNTLAQLFYELGYKVGAEIGTLKGVYAHVLCSNNPLVKLYCVDPYVSYDSYREHRKPGELEGYRLEAERRLRSYNVEFKPFYSRLASEMFDNESLDFVYIDANHNYQSVVEDIASWHPKVRPGGIISGHDYVKRKNKSEGMHVVQAVNGWVDSYSIENLFLLGRKAMLPGEIRETRRSWFYIKE